ncbi:hypothetical protein CVT25_003459 [Psilocybe cyanescens]|uniref:Uncharacterized protein n=1 Tax=Psilocybe cyanescens TaxID=93625 RepID=A0A409X4W3_PSICY|nr:hypothetical protein CVT25_003459 [Psilocybe cyanescens]
MIYTGDETPQDNKTGPAPQNARPGQGSAASAPPPPPSYENHRAFPQVQPHPHPHPHVVAVNSALLVPGHGHGHTARRRFLRAFVVAGLIWLLLTLFLQSLRMTIRWSNHPGSIDSWYYSIPSEVHLKTCVHGGSWTPVPMPARLTDPNPLDLQLDQDQGELYDYYQDAAETFFELPLSSETLFFLSRGDRLAGAIQVKTSADQAPDSASVHILIRYRTHIIIERTKACLVKRNANENGVGLFGPVFRWGSPGSDYSTSFEITVTLPEYSDSSPLNIKNFETDVPNSRHEIADLGGKVFFESIALKGSNSRIKAESLSATTGDIHTSNGVITGTFSTNDTLVLRTTNAAITADVNLRSEKADSRPTLSAKTSNGAIVSNINLISTLEHGQGGFFGVSADTSNAHLDIKFPKSPVDSTLNFKASTSNERASVSLNPAYEGSFDLQTSSVFKTTVDEHRVEDPSGRNRKRQARYRHSGKGVLVGDISWSPENAGRGRVAVSTSNAPVYVRV